MNGTKRVTEAAGFLARGSGRRALQQPAKRYGQRAVDCWLVTMSERVTIKRVRIPFAESLRFPGEGKSAQGESDPKTRPKGVVDGRQVNIPAPTVKVEPMHVTFQGRSPD